jgi:methionyl-tRNA formyltransferase
MIYLFCNGEYGAPFLNAAATRYAQAITAVISTKGNPLPRSAYRRMRAAARRYLDAREFARAHHGLRVVWAPDVNASDFVRRIGPQDHGIITGFNQIFRAPLIERFRTVVNFHPSVLPLYRGPMPSYWCLRNGEAHSGYTAHRVTERIDEGEILFQESVPIAGSADAGEANRRIAARAATTFDRYVRHLMTGEPWQSVRIDAGEVYRCPVKYASFPTPDPAAAS